MISFRPDRSHALEVEHSIQVPGYRRRRVLQDRHEAGCRRGRTSFVKYLDEYKLQSDLAIRRIWAIYWPRTARNSGILCEGDHSPTQELRSGVVDAKMLKMCRDGYSANSTVLPFSRSVESSRRT
jgi:hypothetical protein